VILLLACWGIVAAAPVLAALLAVAEFHHVYFNRHNLPDLRSFTRFEFPTIGHVYDAGGRPLIELAREYREIVRYEDIPPIVRDAILASEDKRFFSHNGIDTFSVPRVLGKIRVGSFSVADVSELAGGPVAPKEFTCRNCFRHVSKLSAASGSLSP
jgi:membrane carboxypeptidase/penicillin-binding protein